jgi:1-acyl-sn-glycerol-3-phosphate acyltransferase
LPLTCETLKKIQEIKKMRNKYKIHWTFVALSKVVIFFFTRIFKVKANISNDIKKIKAPYLLLVNHVGFWDPFLVGYFLRKKPHFVTSDAVLKDPVKRFFLNGFKIISKKKNMRDSKVIRTMLEHTTHSEAVALFPEATRTWTGKTLPIDNSIGKLVKLMQVPVITAKMKGMFLFNPRWAYGLRKAEVEIDYTYLYTKAQISALSVDEISQGIIEKLAHSEWEFQQKAGIKIKSQKRAEFLNHVIFYCPHCHSFHGYTAKNNSLTCKDCGFELFVDEQNNLQATNGELFNYSSIEQLYDYQNPAFINWIRKELKNENNDCLFSDDNVLIYANENESDFEFLGKAKICLYIDKLIIEFADKPLVILPFSEIKTLNPQLRERIELEIGNKAYRLVGETPGLNGIKWELAANVVWQQLEQNFKLSGYFRPFF